jgi:hypothetical protein
MIYEYIKFGNLARGTKCRRIFAHSKENSAENIAHSKENPAENIAHSKENFYICLKIIDLTQHDNIQKKDLPETS